MHLVFLYGPPGVGKLTVARELVALTGFKLFHNHRTIDFVASVFPRGSPAFGPLVQRFRREMVAEATQQGVDLVFTYVYVHPDDEPDVRVLIGPVLISGGSVHFVQLTCARDELLARVADESRQAYRKLTDPDRVGRLLEHADLLAPVPFAESFHIGTTHVPPRRPYRSPRTTRYRSPRAMRRARRLGLQCRVDGAHALPWRPSCVDRPMAPAADDERLALARRPAPRACFADEHLAAAISDRCVRSGRCRSHAAIPMWRACGPTWQRTSEVWRLG